ncbi:hypothetical protein FPV67DRAFT_1667596 [Lyophyllum atratum]|nr:hypothetical protein FPV67DRAFT_1667596 [Lyophyllum atratum]
MELQAVDYPHHLSGIMTGFFVGPMPVEQFLEGFLPAPNVSQPILPPTFFDDMGEKFRKESDMCKAFEEHVPSNLIPGFKIVNTSNDKDLNSARKLRPHPTLYRADLNTDSKKTQLGELELHFELRHNHRYDPFQDPSEGADKSCHNFEATSECQTQSRELLLDYATEWFSRQHRCFGFTVFMGDPDIRFIRWDRAGAIVSAKFNYRENCQPLIDFLWRFTNLDRAGRGWMGSNSAPREAERVVVFTLPDGEAEREFIAWGAMAYPESLMGRYTRAYPVYEKHTGYLGFMKDSWRAEEHEKESAILRTLQKAGVQHIPGLVCGDDIPHQTTVTDLYVPLLNRGTAHLEAFSTGPPVSQRDAPLTEVGEPSAVLPRPENASWRCGNNWRRITRRYHHRMITDVIGHHLKKFTSSKQMMEQAYELCKVIHRDISAYNILITDKGEGILNDWDLAIYEKDIIENLPRRHERTGTWQFMSCLLLQNRHKAHTIQDDIESFFHIILYHSIRYLRRNRLPEVRDMLSEIFDDVYHREEYLPFEDFQLTKNVPLNKWISDALHIMDEWISKVRKGAAAEELRGLRLYSHQYMAEKFANCLEQQGWPSRDKAVDYLPAVAHGSTSSQIGSTGSSRGSGSKRGLTTEDDEEYLHSRSKAKKQKASGSKSSHVLRSSRKDGSGV